jgi:single-stranded-DNA-specific exonuclease
MGVAGIDKGFPISATDIAYQLAPRLNACGRVGQVLTALQLLLTRDSGTAKQLALEADASNVKRKLMDQDMKAEAAEMAKPFVERGDPGLVLGSEHWHKGVIGICASRIVELCGVPAIMCSIEGDEVRGSARSVPGTDVKAAMDRCSGLLVRYGGHAQAAGLTLHARDFDKFREAFLDALRESTDCGPVAMNYDLGLDLLSMTAAEVADLLEGVEQLAPFGEGNRLPIFRCNGVRLRRPPTMMGKTGDHMRFGFAADGPTMPTSPALSREFVCFGHGRTWTSHIQERADGLRGALDERWDILFTLSPNTWRPRDGRSVDPVQQQLLDMKLTEPS